MTTNWKQLLEKRREAKAKNRSLRQCSTGNDDLNKAVSWYLLVGTEYGHASLEPLLLKAIEAFQEILKQGYGAQGYIEESDWAGLSEYYGKVIAQKEQSARKVLAEIKAELEKE